MWAPSARELAALEQQVKAMAQQLQSQQQQWQGFITAASARLPPPPGSSGPGSNVLPVQQPNPSGSGAARSMWAAGSQQMPAQESPEGAVRAKLHYLQSEVEQVIAAAANMAEAGKQHN